MPIKFYIFAAKTRPTCLILVLAFVFCVINPQAQAGVSEKEILSYIVDPQQKLVRLYWKSDDGNNIADFQRLKSLLAEREERLLFASNGGMYNKQLAPKGLYIENATTLRPLDRATKGFGNFYLQPNGIFYLSAQRDAHVVETSKFDDNGQISFATQSGPMLVADGKINPLFNKNSSNLQIRNGVGVLADGKILFALSKQTITFYDFAAFFKQHKCMNALYLDGFVSRAYLPEKHWEQLDGNFAVMIGVSETNK